MVPVLVRRTGGECAVQQVRYPRDIPGNVNLGTSFACCVFDYLLLEGYF